MAIYDATFVIKSNNISLLSCVLLPKLNVAYFCYFKQNCLQPKLFSLLHLFSSWLNINTGVFFFKSYTIINQDIYCRYKTTIKYNL